MVKERASSLKEQEVQLAAMLAALQMEKAKEVTFTCQHLFFNVDLFIRTFTYALINKVFQLHIQDVFHIINVCC